MTLRVDISEKETYPTVLINGDLRGRLVTLLALSPSDAYALLQALEAKRDELRDLATNYYECRDCGYMHQIDCSCATVEQEHEKQWDRTFASPEGQARLSALTAQAEDDIAHGRTEAGGFAPEQE